MPGKKHRKPVDSVCLRILLEAVVGSSRFMLVLAALAAFAPVSQSATVVFTNDVVISSSDTNYDGLEIVVTNCTVTVDGTHAFASLRVLNGGILTHSVSTGHTGLNLTTTGDVWVDEEGAINVDGKGYVFSEGLGNGTQSGSPATGRGAGHGGIGGTTSATGSGGGSYGLAQQPLNKGSTGGLGGGSGGGALRLIVGGAFVLNGTLSANGNPGTTNRSGGGSGGSVWLTAQSISGGGVISANGGSGEFIYGNGGGGGRVAIECETNAFVGSIMAHGGGGAQAGGAGTVYVAVAGANARLSVDNNGRAGANTPVQINNNGCDLAVSSGATVIFPSGLMVGNLSISSNGWLTIPAYQSPGGIVNLTVTGNVTIASQSGILADARGYPTGQGPGRGYASTFLGTMYGSGGGFGGQGGMAPANSLSGPVGGNSYGSVSVPVEPGSGGGGGPFPPTDGAPVGSFGGGAVRLMVGGTLLLDGMISANGGDAAPQGGGGGCGGSIWLTAARLAGSGTISANGGSANPLLGGGGGGGRIAIYYSTNLFTGGTSAHGGDGASAGGAGTIYRQPSGESGHLLVDNGGRNGTTPLMFISGTQDLTIGGGAVAQLSGASPFRDLLIKSSGWLTVPQQQSTLTLNVTRDATIEPGAGIVVDGKGHPAGQGPGSGAYVPTSYTNYGGGGGHGGFGATALHPGARGGNTYGVFDSPSTLGSGGGGFSTPAGGPGGGAIQLNVTGTLRLDGEISADGGAGMSLGGGGGSGGSISVRASTITGAGIVSANGGNANGPNSGGGGGGRIAIYFSTNDFSGATTAYGGAGGHIGGAGTVYVKPMGLTGQLLVDNGGHVGATNTAIMPGLYDLTVGGGGTIGLSSALTFTGDLLVKSNGWVVFTYPFASPVINITGNARIERGGGILAVGAGSGAGLGRGYQSSFGPSGGGGHGGYGGANPSGFGGAFGSMQNPQNGGGAGGSASGSSFPPLGGAGGGALRITVTRAFSMDGKISVDGHDGGANSGGGAGGSVWLTAGTLTGTGIISANGGAGNGTAGGGGGGRIAIYCETNLFGGIISAYGGAGAVGGGAGTIYTRRLNEPIERLLVDNGGQFGTNTPLQNLSAAFELTVRGGAAGALTSSSLSLSNLLIGSGSSLIGFASAINLDMAILGDAVIEAGGSISIDGGGYPQSSGPGAGRSAFGAGSGAGYGGAGGASASVEGGSPYGSAERPTHAGSGGGIGLTSSPGNSQGGGALRLTVGRALTLEGRLGADGNAGLQDNSGGGSGGSIWVMAGAISGDGIISANGGAGEPSLGGGGGGGRIALYLFTNTFTGLTTVLGGEGAEDGQNGTIYTSTNWPVFEVVSQQPTGTVTNIVSHVDLVFSSPLNPYSASASDVIMKTPNGDLGTSNLSVFALGPSTLRISFLEQSAVGDYTITIGPQIEDLFGRPMSQIYTGAFNILLPVIRGVVRDTNGQGVAGVMLQAIGLPDAFTDVNGEYALGVTTGWSGGVIPSLDGFMFVPGSRVYTNVNGSIGNQDYLIVNTIAPAVDGQLQGTNLFLNWRGITGVTYQPLWSTNLVDWFPFGGLLFGSNGVMELRVPMDDDPMKFFRVRSEN
jgi:hypothetical protein